MKIKEFIIENKEGAFLGAISGAIIYWLFNRLGLDIGIVFQTQSMISNILPTITQKTFLFFVLTGLVVGIIFDMNLKEGWLESVF